MPSQITPARILHLLITRPPGNCWNRFVSLCQNYGQDRASFMLLTKPEYESFHWKIALADAQVMLYGSRTDLNKSQLFDNLRALMQRSVADSQPNNTLFGDFYNRLPSSCSFSERKSLGGIRCCTGQKKQRTTDHGQKEAVPS